MNQENSSIDRFRGWLRTSVTVRLLSIGILVLLMLIPIAFVEDLIDERHYRKDAAASEISQKWGNPQTLTGPIIFIPYKGNERIYDETEKTYLNKEVVKHICLLPESLNISAELNSETRKRGIYEAVVYKANVKFDGSFDFNEIKKLQTENIMLHKAELAQGLSDLRSLKGGNVLFGGKKYEFDPGVNTANGVLTSGISCKIKLDSSVFENPLPFSYETNFNGSQSLNFIPVGKESKIKMHSDNPDPKFDGAFLPNEHDITKDGFTAQWSIYHLNRNYPQVFSDTQYSISTSQFGAELLVGVDEYQKNTRAVKYAVLVILLTFMTYFFMQTRGEINIHFIQYLLVGFALSVFYVLLVSLSEHISFAYAYWIGAIAVAGLITGYSHSVLKDKKLTMMTGAILSILYLFIYIIIQLQNYSLLVGSIGLFIVVAAAMFASRNIDWYSLTNKNKEERNPDKEN